MTDAPDLTPVGWLPDAASARPAWRPEWALIVAGLEALLGVAAAATTVYFLASSVLSTVAWEHPVWAAFFAVPVMLALAVVAPIVALAVTFLRRGGRTTFVLASGFTVVAALVGALGTMWLAG